MQLFVNNLCNIDCSCLDQEFGIVGASWIVDIVLEGDLNYQGMVMDFGDVKKHIKNTIDNSLDHTLIIPAKSSDVTIQQQQSSYQVIYNFSKGTIKHISPFEAITLIDSDIITTQILEDFLQQKISEFLANSNLSVNITLHQEHIAGPSYCYSHGLKQHQGNCQRIAHGHRSQIRIIENSKRSTNLEQEWSKLWHGKYLANKDDVKESFTENQIDYTTFEYNALQGRFKLTIPTICCYLIDGETTIEHLSQHICNTLTKQTGKQLKIFAYEGVNKGAISYSNS